MEKKMSFKFEIFTKRLITLVVLVVMIISFSNSAYATPIRLKAMDANKDGKVTQQEFAAKIDQQFAKMDKNNDGVIQHNELKIFHAAKFEKMDRDNNVYLDKKDRRVKKIEEKEGRH
jgi:hypothetical protein